MIPLLAAVYIGLFIMVAARFARTEGYFSAFTIFGIGAFYYYMAIPLELWLRGESQVHLSTITYALPAANQVQIAALGVLALLGFALGQYFSGFRVAEPGPKEDRYCTRIPKAFLALSVGAVMVLGISHGAQFLSIVDTYQEKNIFLYTHPVAAGMIHYVVLGVVLIAAVLMQGNIYRVAAGIVLVACIVAWGFYTLDKNPMVYAAFAFATPWVGRKSRRPIVLIGLSCAAFAVIVGLPLFSAYRGNGSIDASRLASNVSVLDTDAAGPMASLAITLQDEPAWTLGRTYRHALSLLVPRCIWPDRPYGLADQFAMAHRANWKPGDGLGFSPLAEAYMNFGIAGALLQNLLIGYLFGRAMFWAQRTLGRINWPVWRALYATSGFMCLLLLHRSAVNHVTRGLCYEVAVPIVVYLIVDLEIQRYARSARAGRFPSSRTAKRLGGTEQPAGSGLLPCRGASAA